MLNARLSDPCIAEPTLPECPPIGPFDDGDGVPPEIEDSAVTSGGASVAGDNNFDGIIDSLQSNVATLPNPNDQAAPGSFVSLEILPTTITLPDSDPASQVIWNIVLFSPVAAAGLEGGAPTDRNFPVGLFNLSLTGHKGLAGVYPILQALCLPDAVPLEGLDLNCAQATEILNQIRTVQVRLIFDRVIDHSDWTVQKFLNGVYANYPATVQDEVIGSGFLRTTITWTLTDGGSGDADGVMNGSINDPIGPAVMKTVSVANPVTTVASITPASAALAYTGKNLLVSVIALILLGATAYVARSEQKA